MIARKLGHGFAACCLLALGAAAARAVDYLPAPWYEGDSQLFAPADVDFNNLPIDNSCGYSFTFEKVCWTMTGERTPIGTRNFDNASLNPYRQFTSGGGIVDPDPLDDDDVFIFDPGTRVVMFAPLFRSGIDSGPPDAQFAWAERYEFGYSNGESGWKMSILDGPTSKAGQVYGLNTQDTLIGSVLVVFDDPQFLMFGFLDAWSTIGQGGPFTPDGQVDDVDEDGQHGPGFDLETPAWIPETRILGIAPDFEDVVRLPTSWQFLDVRNETESTGVELMRTHKLSNDHFMAKHQNTQIHVAYGVRYLRLRDNFRVIGNGGVMGFSAWSTEIDNNLIGPQIELGVLHQWNRVLFDFNGRFLAGYNPTNFDQNVSLGQDLVPGQYNRPLWFPPTVVDHGKREDEFAPAVEMRLQAKYQLTSALAVKLGYTAIFIDGISRAAPQVRYELPRMGFNDHTAGEQEILINGVDFGFEAVY